MKKKKAKKLPTRGSRVKTNKATKSKRTKK